MSAAAPSVTMWAITILSVLTLGPAASQALSALYPGSSSHLKISDDQDAQNMIYSKRMPPLPFDKRMPPLPFDKRMPPLPFDKRMPPLPFDKRMPPLPFDKRMPPLPFDKRMPPLPFDKRLSEKVGPNIMLPDSSEVKGNRFKAVERPLGEEFDEEPEKRMPPLPFDRRGDYYVKRMPPLPFDKKAVSQWLHQKMAEMSRMPSPDEMVSSDSKAYARAKSGIED